jgi:5'-3' exoribonuclease 2
MQGVPALFRWLSKKYPKIVQRVVEDTPSKVLSDTGDVVVVPIKYDSPNPNGFEVDNLYRKCRPHFRVHGGTVSQLVGGS